MNKIFSKKNNKKELEEILNNTYKFFCISYFEGDLEWISYLKKSNGIIYNKSGNSISTKINSITIDNVGYNIYSYLKFIIDNYENLPNIIVFCKNNIMTRHIKENTFKRLIKRDVFTPLEDPIQKRNYPFSIEYSDNRYNELDGSFFYKFKFDRKYFASYSFLYNYVFKDVQSPKFIKFAPGANYIVPKENILIRTKEFYTNLLLFVSHSQFSCESHFIERILNDLWNSNIESSPHMNKILSTKEVSMLKRKCEKIKLIEKYTLMKFKSILEYKILRFIEVIFNKLNLK